MPERLGSFALTQDASILLLGLESRLALFDLVAGTCATIAASPGQAGTCINDGRCDRVGNFVFGTMHEAEVPERIGGFYRLNAATMAVEQLALPGVAIANSIGFSPDGQTLYYCDSLQQHISCCDYPSRENQRIFASITGAGAPDGSCIDAQGHLWNAEWGGARVVRYAPDGSVERVLSAAAQLTTCPVFGGPSYDRLFCTSATVGLTAAAAEDGALLVAQIADAKGLPESRFAVGQLAFELCAAAKRSSTRS